MMNTLLSGLTQELIQNAEDAGATEVRFLYDRRQYGQDPRYLHHRELANFQVRKYQVYL